MCSCTSPLIKLKGKCLTFVRCNGNNEMTDGQYVSERQSFEKLVKFYWSNKEMKEKWDVTENTLPQTPDRTAFVRLRWKHCEYF